jgi:hypothetical protein
LKKIYAVSIDGTHAACFETVEEAVQLMCDLHKRGFHYFADYAEDDFKPTCDCKNTHLSKEFLKENPQ